MPASNHPTDELLFVCGSRHMLFELVAVKRKNPADYGFAYVYGGEKFP
jgi:hypothetical protein